MTSPVPKNIRLPHNMKGACRFTVLAGTACCLFLAGAGMLAARYPVVTAMTEAGRVFVFRQEAVLLIGGVLLVTTIGLAAMLVLSRRQMRRRVAQAGEPQTMPVSAGPGLEPDADTNATARSRARFLSMMNHDVRTPMNGILGMTELLLQTDLDREQRRCATLVHDSGAHLVRILDNILEHARLESGGVRIAPAPFDPAGLLREAQERWAPAAQTKNLGLDVRAHGTLPTRLRGDAARIRQVLDSLVHNAIRFTDKGAVSIALRAGESAADPASVHLYFTVTDTGTGLARHDAKRLFPPLPAAGAPEQAWTAGTGLGLEICRRLVRLMGGEIGAHSEAGKGATFFFHVPCGRDVEALEPLAPPDSASTATAPAIRPAPASAATSRPPRLLVAEDGDINRQLIQILLTQIGYEADYALNGQEAVDAIAQADYDLVLMDCMMPVMDGYTAAQRIRALEATRQKRRIPIIALTASTQDGEADRCLAAGMDDYLPKPFTGDVFTRRVDYWLKR
jgi:signal transduction histidine kinase/CheY-like chemotaxis protein